MWLIGKQGDQGHSRWWHHTAYAISIQLLSSSSQHSWKLFLSRNPTTITLLKSMVYNYSSYLIYFRWTVLSLLITFLLLTLWSRIPCLLLYLCSLWFLLSLLWWFASFSWRANVECPGPLLLTSLSITTLTLLQSFTIGKPQWSCQYICQIKLFFVEDHAMDPISFRVKA